MTFTGKMVMRASDVMYAHVYVVDSLFMILTAVCDIIHRYHMLVSVLSNRSVLSVSYID